MTRTWLTVDFDDLRHVPSAQGHPTRSKNKGQSEVPSIPYQLAMRQFEQWLSATSYPVTLFVIADLFENEQFCEWFDALLTTYGERLTVGCHGLTHRSWSAWPEDINAFSEALQKASDVIRARSGEQFRPWFRAPAGYMAPWMASVLAQHGYTLDTSVNPSWLMRKKAGKGNSWADVTKAVRAAELIERPWTIAFGLPVNGPALNLFPLSVLARRTWRKAPPVLMVSEVDAFVNDEQKTLATLYWHVLDHARKKGTWTPPLR